MEGQGERGGSFQVRKMESWKHTTYYMYMALWIPQTATVINGSNWDKRHFPLVNEVLKHTWNENTSKLTTHQVKFKTSKQQNNKNAQLKWHKGLPSILFCLWLDWTKSPINGPSQTFVLAGLVHHTVDSNNIMDSPTLVFWEISTWPLFSD